MLLLLLMAAVAVGAQPADLDRLIADAMREFEVPGVAVAIVKDGRVVVTKGYGVRKLGGSAAVDEHTLFGIASNTKAFTTAALAILVDEGKLRWDDAVVKHLPVFAMADPYVSREITVRDLVTHRSGLGLGAGDLMFWPDTKFTRAQVVAGVRHLKPATSIRSRYAYNNTLYVVAGEVIAAVSGMPYEEFIERRLLRPLAMTETRMSNRGLSEAANTAVPHSRGWRLEGALRSIPWTEDFVWAAAAGIKTNAQDFSKWMLLQLARGMMPGGGQLFSPARSREMWAAQTVIDVAEPEPAMRALAAKFAAYGLGWSLRDYRGRKLVSHSGGLTGMVSLTTLVPDEDLGIALFTNQEEPAILGAITNQILDHYLGAKPEPWLQLQKERRDKRHAEAVKREEEARKARRAQVAPSLALQEFAGEYVDGWYGAMRISLDGGELKIAMMPTPAMRGRLEHWQGNTFVARWADLTIPDAYVTFQLDENLKVTEVRMNAISDLADFSFDFHDLRFLPAGADPPAKH
jgi:CubicO group peptidase (beta-lactamase class C family)